MLFRMVPKLSQPYNYRRDSFRAVLFRMVPKLIFGASASPNCFRAVLFRMVPKRGKKCY